MTVEKRTILYQGTTCSEWYVGLSYLSEEYVCYKESASDPYVMYKCLDNKWCDKMTPNFALGAETTSSVTVGDNWTKNSGGVWKETTNTPSLRDEFDQKGDYCVNWVMGSPIHQEPG
jgi:transcription elongation factor